MCVSLAKVEKARPREIFVLSTAYGSERREGKRTGGSDEQNDGDDDDTPISLPYIIASTDLQPHEGTFECEPEY
jgi:hypothetical protein